MLEVVFGRSARGSLRVAQHCESCASGAVSAVVLACNGSTISFEEHERLRKKAEERERARFKNAVSLGGDPDDVFCFFDDLSIGDISGDCFSQSRWDYLEQIFYTVYREDCYYHADYLKKIVPEFDRFAERAQKGEAVRIWFSEQPFEYCNFYWFIDKMKNALKTLPPITVIKLPNVIEKGTEVEICKGWGGVAPEDFHKFISLEKNLSPASICYAVSKWQQLQQENAPLRAVVNGSLQSVDADFYDPFIKKEISKMETEFSEPVLICNILNNCNLGIGDFWISLRIEDMIAKGELRAVTNPKPDEPVYRKMLRKIR